MIRTDNKVHCMEAHPLYGALSQRGLVDPIKPAYNKSWPDGWLRLTASAFNRLWISMPTVLITVPTVMQKSLHPLSTSSIIACHLLDFMVHGKGSRGRCTDSPSGRHPIRTMFPHVHQGKWQGQCQKQGIWVKVKVEVKNKVKVKEARSECGLDADPDSQPVWDSDRYRIWVRFRVWIEVEVEPGGQDRGRTANPVRVEFKLIAVPHVSVI